MNYATNPKASFDYDIQETLVAGLVLIGAEVKSVKNGNISLTGAYVTASPNGAALINCHIGPYKYAQSVGYEPTQTRKLLLKQKEISQLLGKEKGGLPDTVKNQNYPVLEIPQYGLIHSLNLSCSGSIVIYHYLYQHYKGNQ